MFRAWFRMKLWARVLIGLVLGVAAGALLGEKGIGVAWFNLDPTVWSGLDAEGQRQWLVGVREILQPIGDIFINLIKMLIVPLILTTLVAGMASMGHPQTMGRMGLKALGLFFFTTAFAIMIGIGFGVLFEPGAGLTFENVAPRETPQDSQSLVDRLVNLIPTNPVEALVKADVLQIIVFALLVGVGIVLAGERGRPLKDVFDSASEVMLQITRIVMELAPLGVFALIAVVAGSYGLEVLQNLAKLILVVYAACITHIVLVYWLLLIRIVANLPVIRFIRGMIDAQAVAYSTSSSNATLPVNIACARDNLGVDKSTAGFVLPLGATINMDGTALYLGILAVFAAQIFNVDLSLADYGVIILTATLTSIGAAGIPSASLVLLGIVFSSVGFSAEQTGIVLGLIFGVDRIMDMMRTLTNITGDAVISVLVAKSEGTLDEVTYRTPAVR